MTTRCPAGKILNPATGRCVTTHGKIGRTLVARDPYALKPRNFATHALNFSEHHWQEYPALHHGATDIQRAQHRIRAHKHKIKYHEKWTDESTKAHDKMLARKAALAHESLANLKAKHNAARAKRNAFRNQHFRGRSVIGDNIPGGKEFFNLVAAEQKAAHDVRAKQYGPNHLWYKQHMKQINHHTSAIKKEHAHMARNKDKLAKARARARRS